MPAREARKMTKPPCHAVLLPVLGGKVAGCHAMLGVLRLRATGRFVPGRTARLRHPFRTCRTTTVAEHAVAPRMFLASPLHPEATTSGARKCISLLSTRHELQLALRGLEKHLRSLQAAAGGKLRVEGVAGCVGWTALRTGADSSQAIPNTFPSPARATIRGRCEGGGSTSTRCALTWSRQRQSACRVASRSDPFRCGMRFPVEPSASTHSGLNR